VRKAPFKKALVRVSALVLQLILPPSVRLLPPVVKQLLGR
jgi:hypothetical protein